MKYTLIEIKTEEEFIKTFGENPRWILSLAPKAAKSNEGGDNVPERDGTGRSKRGTDNKTTS